MPLNPGTTIGSYTVTAKIGEGGMGEVYQARDTKLDRDVALKVLPEAFTADRDRLARFEREAKVLASLNHPNIGTIYGLEEAEGVRALILELIEGPTLADRIAQGPIPIDEALPIAKQIAEALEAAHEQGVIHRDLKPANIKVKADGTVKVLDFGLAKALAGDAQGPDLSQSPTMTASMGGTREGVILGTAAYMSPEHARGQTLDKRTDIWSFGCVLYEILTGRAAFGGETLSDTIANVIEREPAWAALPADLPAVFAHSLRRCVRKNPRQRVHDVADVRLAMEDAFETTVAAPFAPVAAPQLQIWQRPIPAAIGALVMAAITGAGVWNLTRPEILPADLVRFSIVPSPPLDLPGVSESLAISPDGMQIVYRSPGNQLNLRPIDQLVGVPLRGAEGSGIFFSPDSESVGFVSPRTTLQTVDTVGGSPVTVTQSPNRIAGATWGADNQIIFGTADSGLFRVAGGGGEPEALTMPDREQQEQAHAFPFIIPDTEAVLFAILGIGPPRTNELAVLDLDTGDVTPLGLTGVSPRYVSTGHLVYAGDGGAIRAVAFDATSLEVTGGPVSLVEGVRIRGIGAADFSISDNGRLVYFLGINRTSGPQSFVWVDRDGREEPVPVAPDSFEEFNLSPEGDRVAVRVSGDDPYVAIVDVNGGTATRLTFESDNVGALYPTWTHDGTRVAFGPPLSWKHADGSGEVETLSDDPVRLPQAFSADGTTLIFRDRLPGSEDAVGMLTLEGDRSSTILLDEGFTERSAVLSPDGRWLAYSSNETGQFEVYVKPFPDVEAGRWPISSGGGARGRCGIRRETNCSTRDQTA